METIDGPHVPAASGKADSLIVFVHGYGADGEDLIGLASYFQKALPNAACAAPNAPERIPGQPFGYQWFGITRLDPNLMAAGADSAAATLEAFIAAELQRTGVDPTRLVLVGFSQGTMMSLHVGLRLAVQPAAIVGFSGALVAADRLKNEITVRPPVLLVHGDSDPMIPVEALHAATNGLAAAGVSVRWHVARGVGHSIDPEGLKLAIDFVRDALAGKMDAAG